MKDVFGDLRLGELAHAVESVVAENRHDSGNDLASNASFAAVTHPVVEDLVVKEELGDDKVRAGIHLLFQVLDIVLPGCCL